MRHCLFHLLAVVIAIAAMSGVSRADLVTIVDVSYSGTASAQGGLNLDNPDNIINGSGLSGSLAADASNLTTITHAAVSFTAPGNVWATIDAGSAGGDWFTSGQNNGSVVFDFSFGQTYEVDQLAVWGYYFGTTPNGNSISEVELRFSTDGGATFDSTQSNVAIALPSGANYNLATIVGLTPTNANFVSMTVTDNYFGGAPGGGGDRVGIAEIAFTGTAVPEPSSSMMVAISLGAVLFSGRRRRAK